MTQHLTGRHHLSEPKLGTMTHGMATWVYGFRLLVAQSTISPVFIFIPLLLLVSQLCTHESMMPPWSSISHVKIAMNPLETQLSSEIQGLTLTQVNV